MFIGAIIWSWWWLCFKQFTIHVFIIRLLTYNVLLTNKSPEHTDTHTRSHSFLTYHMLMSENNTCISALAAASSRPSVRRCGVCTCMCVCVYVWALGFSLADVSNQSLSRGSLSLYPLSVEPWVNRTGPVHPLVVQRWLVVGLMMGMGRHLGGGAVPQ